ncbi:hypothetical protein GCM10027159_10650 [Lysobacter terrae]
MVVMAIIAALIMIALPRYQGSVQNAKLTALTSSLRVMREGIDHFYEDKGRLPESLQELVEAKYIKNVPVDPLTDSAQTWMLKGDPEGKLEGVADIASGARGLTPQGVAYSDL